VRKLREASERRRIGPHMYRFCVRHLTGRRNSMEQLDPAVTDSARIRSHRSCSRSCPQHMSGREAEPWAATWRWHPTRLRQLPPRSLLRPMPYGTSALASQELTHWLTPPWPEQVPEWWVLYDQSPSLQRAVAPDGGVLPVAGVGSGTHMPLSFAYVPPPQVTNGNGAVGA
jgi:hypothetical protein